MNRQIGIDFAMTTSAICVRDTDKQPDFIRFNGESYTPTVILEKGTVTNKKGEEVAHDEAYGWEAQKATSFHGLLKDNFKIKLLSEEKKERQEAESLTRKFFKYLYESYKNGMTDMKGTKPEKVTTVVTYPVKFPKAVQNFLKQAAEEAGFENVIMKSESEAAMRYVQTHETEKTRNFTKQHAGKQLKVLLEDMGGGTSDSAVFKYNTEDPEKLEVLGFYPKGGELNFGGSEIDGILCEFYKQKIGSHIVKILGQGDEVLGEKVLRNMVKKHKEEVLSPELQANQTAGVPMGLAGFVYMLSDPNCADIDRTVFEELLKEYLPQFPKLVNGALEDAGIRGEEIDLVLLSGGHSQWYFVKEMLLKETKLAVKEDAILSFPKPHLVVAEGAALMEKKAPAKTISGDPMPTPPKQRMLAWVKKNGKYGLIDQDGNMVTACEWDGIHLDDIKSGAIRVEKNGKWGLIDKNGKQIIPCQWYRIFEFSDGLAKVSGNEGYGFINSAGNLVIPCRYTEAHDFSDGLARVSGGYINTSGKLVIPGKWIRNDDFHEGLAAVCKHWYSHSYDFIDKTGKTVLTTKGFSPDSSGFCNGFVRGEPIGVESSYTTFRNRKGEEISSYGFDFARDFCDGLAMVCNDDRWNYLKENGKLLTSRWWEKLGEFHEGLAYAQSDNENGYIDKTGQLVISGTGLWSNGRAFHEGLAYVRKNGKYGFINMKGEVVVPFILDNVYGGFYNGLAAVSKNGKWGYIDKNGNEVIPCEWDDASPFVKVD
ncbi:MAG: WG repeat-containing protein [Firmicutes bacterium]|nr:WG repeat-containing protein [Bacillota bacterium]